MAGNLPEQKDNRSEWMKCNKYDGTEKNQVEQTQIENNR